MSVKALTRRGLRYHKGDLQSLVVWFDNLATPLTCGLMAPPAGLFSSGFIAGKRSTCNGTASAHTPALQLTHHRPFSSAPSVSRLSR